MQLRKPKKIAEEIVNKFPKIIKAVWLLPGEKIKTGYTLIFLLDDTESIDSLTVNEVKIEVEKLIKNLIKKPKVDTLFYKLSDYWELIRHGSPVTFTEIREGIPIYDPSGFFVPLKKLLLQGRVPGTKEAMRNLIQQATFKLLRIEREYMFKLVMDLYSAVNDAGQAPLMLIGVAPPSPREIPKKLQIHFVRKRKLEPEYVRYYKNVLKTAKAIEHGKIKNLELEKVDELIEDSTKFINRMIKLFEEISKEK